MGTVVGVQAAVWLQLLEGSVDLICADSDEAAN
jgi:hypothetical protein